MSVEFTAPPTCARFMRSAAYGRILAGPVGSGKTTTCIIETLRRSLSQARGADGCRYTRFAFVRQTLKQLKDTVLKDTVAWLGGLGAWKVSDTTFYLDFGDVHSEWIFVPLEDAEDQARLLSMQLTGCWISEAIECSFDILAPISGRIGRYPSAARGTPTWHGIYCDTNMPTDQSEWHRFMTNPPPNWQIFIQPGGMSARAENLNHLLQTEATVQLPLDDPRRLAQGRTYYENFIAMYGSDHPWIRRYVDAEYGEDPSGEAVFRATFKASFHCVEDTFVIPGYPLVVGIDFGRNPWALIAQMDHMGRLLVHAEVPAVNVGLEKQVQTRLKPMLMSERFATSKVILVGDPAGVAKGTIAEETSFDALKRLGLPAFPAPTNDIDPRLRAVEAMLGQQINGGPALVISRRGCPKLVSAMSSGYRFKKHKEGALRTVPEKFDVEGYSHVADCLQYVCLVVHGGLVNEYARRIIPITRKPMARISYAGWT